MVEYPVDVLNYSYLNEELFRTSNRIPQIPFFENDIYASCAVKLHASF
jgi:hypothetical protein